MDTAQLRALLDVGRSLISELEPDAVLRRLLTVARGLTGARYAAIGVLDEQRVALERFITSGIDEAGQRAIGDLPRGRGVLGLLIETPEPLRIADVGEHSRSYGFPPGHPAMRSFLGVPILIQGAVWGNLYLTEKPDGAFTDDDEEAVIILSEWAAIAIHNARLYRDMRRRGDELERANRGLATTAEVSRALAGVTDVQRAFELVTKRARALLHARAAELALVDGDDIVIAAVAGEGVEGVQGARLPIASTLAGVGLESRRTQRIDDIPPSSFAATHLGARSAIITPLVFHSRPVGLLLVLDRFDDRPFTAEDERLLDAFASSAAAAVGTAQSATDEALRRSISASEEERRRWARELHDETLQDFAGLSVLLSGARRTKDPQQLDDAVDQAVDMIRLGIENLRSLITDLRPAALDELGAEAAIDALGRRVSVISGLEVELDLDLGAGRGRAAARHPPDVESTVYRVVQEALNNVVKHAGAEKVAVHVSDRGGAIDVRVADDGSGFDPTADAQGFGLVGMRERLALVRGIVRVESSPGAGTTVSVRIPLGDAHPPETAVQALKRHDAPMPSPTSPLNVVVAGGGVAGLETLMALRDLAGARVRLTLLTPEDDFVYRPMAVAAPFARGHAKRIRLDEILGGLDVDVVRGALEHVDVAEREAVTSTGDRLGFDALVVATGAHSAPALTGATTWTPEADADVFGGLLRDLEEGYTKRLAFVVPPGVAWPLPGYELALMTAWDARGMGRDDVQVTIYTHEAAPLAVFGQSAVTALQADLDEVGIAVEAGASVRDGGEGEPRFVVEPGGHALEAQRVVSLPIAVPNAPAGLVVDERGFVTVDRHGAVQDAENVWAAGDVINFPVKQGGLAAQQADAVAEAIARRAGADVEPEPFRAVLRGVVLTGRGKQWVRRDLDAGDQEGDAARQALWWPPTKIAGRYLSGTLMRMAEDGDGTAPPPPGQPVELDLDR